MTINVWSDSMQHIELLGKPALFSDSRVDRSTVPDGWYVYDLRGSDYDPDLISTLEARVIVNYMKKCKKLLGFLLTILLLTCLFSTTALAAGTGDVAGAIALLDIAA